MFKFIKNIFGSKQDKDIKEYEPLVNQINSEFEKLSGLSLDELRQKTNEFRGRIDEHLSEINKEIDALKDAVNKEEDLLTKEAIYGDIDKLTKERDTSLEVVLKEILPEAFAVVKETAKRFTNNEEMTVVATEHDRELAAKGNKGYVRIEGDKAVWKNSWIAGGGEVTWNMIHYDVQLIGGMTLHDGKIAEMATGEGKTLVATLPAYLNGLTGLGTHVITVNDYLAKRDSEWVGPIFEFLFLTIDCIDKYQPHSPGRKEAYKCDITYGTNNEYGFDYLRDNMVKHIDDKVQGKLHYVMVDEVDSVLIDDARTPLIISGPVSKGVEEQEYIALKPLVEKLIATQKQDVTARLAVAKKLFKDNILGHNDGEAGMEIFRAYRGLPKYRPLIKFMSTEGVKVNMQKAEAFYMQENSKNMFIVDDPLLFTIDEKNRNVDLTEKGAEFLAKGQEDANFFIMPNIAEDMMLIESDDNLTEEEKKEKSNEIAQDFSIKSKRLHTVSQLLKAYTLFTKEEDYVVMDGEVKIVDEQTGRMMDGRRYSDGLHQALEAKEEVKVGDITQTYATVTLQNYFRMYHKLAGMTGTAETEAGEFWEIYKLDVVVIPTNRPIIRDDREDLVYKTAQEKYNAVIEEITRLSGEGRPVLVGTTTVDVSEKLSKILNMRGITHNVLNAKQHLREADIVAEAGLPGRVTIATNMAGRGTDIKISEDIKSKGGLAIIGTERHDSRRVDRQLRGRAGRQGDPGSSQFFVSLEDNLMRLFNSDRIAKLMDKMGHQEGEVIQHSMVTKSIERAQKKVEENNFGIRKRLLDYDDVMNIQREAIYSKRNNALKGDRLSVDIYNMMSSLVEDVVYEHKSGGNYETFTQFSLETLGYATEISEDDFARLDENSIVELYNKEIFDFYSKKEGQLTEILLPMIKDIFEKESHKYKRISIPYTDGRAVPLPISANLEEAVNSEGHSIMRDVEKTVTLSLIDDEWKDHLRGMDELKESVQAASFEQKDPLVVYKMEAYKLFENLVYTINENVTSYLLKGRMLIKEQPQAATQIQSFKAPRLSTNQDQRQQSEAERMQRAAAQNAGGGARQKPETFKRQEAKVGRNDACPCGSGKKFKRCHGSNT